MRVAMFGYQTWGHRTLRALLDSAHEVVLVVTHPKSDHAYEKIWSDSVADLAAEHGVPVVLRNRPDDLDAVLKEAEPDIIVANNWRTWLPPEIFRLPPHGTLNVHDSLLPAYAGFSPLIWALINGEQEVGVTAHLMDDELDAGDIVLQRSVPVGPRDTSVDLFHKTVDLIAPVVTEALDLIASGRTDWTPQDRSKATFFHKRSIEDSRIDWTWPAEDIDRLVRAQVDPYPNAFTYHKGERLRIVRASVSEGRYGGTPGRIFIREGDGVVIVAGADARSGRNHGLVVETVRTDDDRELPATEYFRTMGGYLTAQPLRQSNS
ncbi:methionyl-tRNA formyltransferase [Amycolatopsis bartoniae]|uniref:Methionyl-tRNA formyltransferase n=1 Tax=Amycolatopsis bartoniae TaxID=941986 RepID=A0A8H9IZ10_9PSEU|nr:methionyl-tRNA formyltransferase [Amycolatopsis bartoniae]MBB2933772.1 methionyl-tRNA formyltransferase [Amycolatopsis bartoniae]TVT10567.1 methionyl-tRNA formyltransferase [Amycolatopsis bartoniae]GHF71839.1 methionyl-tRNA formyltransferase [Amycolatopsis bartoniae]